MKKTKAETKAFEILGKDFFKNKDNPTGWLRSFMGGFEPGSKKTGFRKKTLAIIQKANQIISEYEMPLTVRQIYYRFVAEQLIPNNLNSYKSLANKLANGRKAGLIDYESIVDRTRQPIKDNSWSSPKNFFNTVKKAYKRNLLADQDLYLEVWCEKDALAGVIEPITNKYDINLQVGRGYPSLSAIYQASKRMKDGFVGNEKRKRIVMLYLGDFDPSGIDIERDIGNRLQNIFSILVDVQRVALTKQDIEEHELPPSPAKRSDSRSRGFIASYGDISVELDALPPNVLVRKIEKAIKQNIDLARYQKQVELEKKDKTHINKLLKNL